MSRRSLQASAKGISKAEAALIRNSLTQQGLAGELGISRQPVTKFFQGKAVDRYIFVTICEKLNLNWEEIVKPSSFPEEEASASFSQIQVLVQNVREKVHNSIQRRCGVMRVLDMEKPRRLDNIYTPVYIWERIARRRRLEIGEIVRDFDPTKFNCFNLGVLQQPRLPAIEAVESYDKLMILGKPGSGKTIFLKWLAIQCNLGEYRGDRVPIFIDLNDFAQIKEKPSLLEYITEQFEDCGVTTPNAALTLLTQGQAVVLLDGLDRVRDRDYNRILQEICQFTTRFYANSFVITCRVAAQNYIFEQFTEVEIADFDEQQITQFAIQWFQDKAAIQSEDFLYKLRQNQSLKSLATSPLLLTFLCLFFEDRADFNLNTSAIYQEVLDILLTQWDKQRHIQRDMICQQITVRQTAELLRNIAKNYWYKGEYLFLKAAIEQQIREYILSLDLTGIDSAAILKYIQAHNGLLLERARGIYSFSHIGLQKYLAGINI
ncbi:NACHT domain-containing protein [Calothrix sp. FACHB-1219]|uniref:NACHT domain-containing protein n=1 Tax=unclassified Calothrix TaxID=2619626 RepID=UPI001685127F|nr:MULTISPECIES: NACHT domain-containing protein [unclassified Calothrix]MBD2203668.1 NACHT domain-containing protein [Calothrix sp. FACHB-168]MBD2219974.1 NACHT domain-containing protein [Calothrix sp. FACHB-1219]